MIRKTLFAAAAVATLAAGLTATAAEAKPNWDINVNLGGYGPGYGPGFGFYDGYGPGYPVMGHPHHHHVEPMTMDYGISCKEGRWSVRNAGFHNVQVQECQGKSFTYFATRHGSEFEVRVSRRSGNIISVNEI
ncbi:MAG: hypothetical protein U1E15_08390 [Hyphomicrobiales bacterium]